MNEIRKDYILDRWIIISPARSKRPHVFHRRDNAKAQHHTCPFCYGNEHLTPPEILRKPQDKKWKIRVVENKYPALVDNLEFKESVKKLLMKTTGYGKHLVIIDSPDHSKHPGFYSLSQWNLWFETLKDLVSMFMADENINYVFIFKNHGPEAGASLEHPHSQLIALPKVPFTIAEELSKASEYYQTEGRCIFCDIIEIERKIKKRVVVETDKVIAITPFAPRWPYEVWILPKHHTPSIYMRKTVQKDLLKVLRAVLRAYYELLEDPPFNFYFHMAYPRMKDHVSQSYHFHIEVFPRLERDAGFELGAGMNITTISPEKSAKELRNFIKGALK
ncbi:MAG: galactose-1-phosphate uridylyltransferase [Candidatus Aenigmarchaeota archaeon]|nr:galactose-1-phosphate uridylyltransferase [Candidatus Aenigmarchaeota archaeon]